MSVLTLAGKPINWLSPPKATTSVLWSQRDTYGRKVIGSLRTIAHLDELNRMAINKFGRGVVVIQPPNNKGVAASAGTHDFDACLDLYIPGVSWRDQETFFRARGFACWWRRPPAFGNHIHGFTLPPAEGSQVSDDFKVAGFKVGKYVDGGYSLYGRLVTSSQIADYYAHRTGLAGHASDSGSWFPPNIRATIFDLPDYLAKQKKAAMPVKTQPRPLALSWNLRTGRKTSVVKRELSALIRANRRPAVVAVQEASTYAAVLKALGVSLRYVVHQPRNAAERPAGVQAREGRSSALLIRKNVPIREKGAIRCAVTWKGPWHGKVREGRVFPWAVVKIGGAWTLVASIHMPTGKNGQNRKAWNEAIAKIESLAREKNLPFLLLGDWNDRWTSTDDRSPRALAKRLRGALRHTTTNLDYALVRGLNIRVTKGSARGSDHPAIRIYRKK